jgi:hypothetical protein
MSMPIATITMFQEQSVEKMYQTNQSSIAV